MPRKHSNAKIVLEIGQAQYEFVQFHLRRLAQVTEQALEGKLPPRHKTALKMRLALGKEFDSPEAAKVDPTDLVQKKINVKQARFLKNYMESIGERLEKVVIPGYSDKIAAGQDVQAYKDKAVTTVEHIIKPLVKRLETLT